MRDTGSGGESLGEAFWGVARRVRHADRDSLSPWGITPSQWRALATLARMGPSRLSALSERLRIAPRSTTEVVDALEEQQLVVREPDPSDRRATLVAVSEQGWDMVKGVQRAKVQSAESVFGVLTDSERARLLALLRKVAAQ